MMKRMIALSAALTMALGWGATPASAATVKIDKNVVMIQESVTGEWDTALRQAVKFLDGYTRTRMVFGTCRAYANRCITVAYGTPSSRAWVGQCGPSCGPSRPVSRVIVRKSWTGSGPVKAKRQLLAHELAHAFGLEHSSSFSTIMYPWVYRRWVLAPFVLAASQKAVLRRY